MTTMLMAVIVLGARERGYPRHVGSRCPQDFLAKRPSSGRSFVVLSLLRDFSIDTLSFLLFFFFLQLCTAFGLVGAVSYVLIKNRPERPATARDYPYSGLEKELGGVNVARKEQVDEE